MSSPAIRFAGFTEDWEEREFENLVSRVPSMAEGEPGLPSVEYEDIVSGQGQLNKNIYEKQNNKRGIYFRPGDILFGKLRPYLQNWLAPNFTGIAVGDWWVLRPNDANSEFIYALIQSLKYQEVSNLTTGTKMPRSDWNIVSKTPFILPSEMAEQAKIGATFCDLDRLITLHQREHDKTVNIKKALLEKMFPKDGEDKPEIRFAGFTDAWESRKIGDLCCEFRSGEFIKTSDISPSGDYPVYGGNGLRGYASFYNHDGEFALIGRQGALCGNMQLSCGKAYFTEHAVAVMANDNNNTLFLYYLLGTMNLGQYSGQSAQPGLAVGKLNALESRVPVKAEQEKISEFFTNIDRLIALHQRELTKLQNIKKALLEKMFV